MEILVLGWSDIVRRRVLPALKDVTGGAPIHLATLGDPPTAGTLPGRIWSVLTPDT